jgi:regulator of protease activity HflC (stomatin/prohibitin superfamily)
MEGKLPISKWATIVSVVIALLVSLGMWGIPRYRVWQRELSGQAQLAEAEWTRKIVVEEANAKMEAAKLLAQAEVERAKGVAEANKIIGESLNDNESYLRYLWIRGLHDGSSEVIYIPTEANLPILEAARKTTGK